MTGEPTQYVIILVVVSTSHFLGLILTESILFSFLCYVVLSYLLLWGYFILF